MLVRRLTGAAQTFTADTCLTKHTIVSPSAYHINAIVSISQLGAASADGNWHFLTIPLLVARAWSRQMGVLIDALGTSSLGCATGCTLMRGLTSVAKLAFDEAGILRPRQCRERTNLSV